MGKRFRQQRVRYLRRRVGEQLAELEVQEAIVRESIRRRVLGRVSQSVVDEWNAAQLRREQGHG